jgi:predicted transcriptional regulator
MLRVAGLMPINDGQLQINRVPDRVQGVDRNKVMEIFNRDANVMQVTRLAAVTTTRPHPNRPAAP